MKRTVCNIRLRVTDVREGLALARQLDNEYEIVGLDVHEDYPYPEPAYPPLSVMAAGSTDPTPVREDPAPAPPAAEEPGEEGPSDPVVLPTDLPYLGTLRKSGLALSEIEARVRAGEATSIPGIGDAGAEKLADYFGVADQAPAGEEDDEWAGLAGDPEPEEEVTVDDMRMALGALGQKKGINEVKRLVKEVAGVTALVDIPADKYAAVRRAAEEALANG